MRIIVRPVVDPQREIDLTQCLVAAIAEELWRLYGGNAQLNWLEAELHLQRIVGDARAAARETSIVSGRPAGALPDEAVLADKFSGSAAPRPRYLPRRRGRLHARAAGVTRPLAPQD